MGWLFGKKKKKVPQVPFPDKKKFDENTLNLSRDTPNQRVINHEDIKSAVGTGSRDVPTPPTEEPLPKEKPKKEDGLPPVKEEAVSQHDFPKHQFSTHNTPTPPSVINVEDYKKILGDLQEMKEELTELKKTNNDIDKSEYNEEKQFTRLKRANKQMHDYLLQADKIMFKGE